VTTTFEIKRNKLFIQRQEKTVPLDRKLNYVHRIFYQREYAADLKTTNINNFVSSLYNESGDTKISIIKKFCKPFILWLSVQNILAIFYNAAIINFFAKSIANC